MSQQATTPTKKAITKPEVMILELIDRRESSWILEGSREQGLPQFLDAPVQKRILNQSVAADDREDAEPNSYRKLRYLSACDTPWVDEQEKLGYVADEKGVVRNRAAGIDDIWFENGRLTVINAGSQKGLYEYLRNCSMNADAPSLPSNANIIFRELKSQRKAEDALAIMDARAEATSFIKSTYTKEANGYTYDEKKIDYLSTLFGLVPLDSPAEKVAALMMIAEAQPMLFLNTMADSNKEKRQEVLESIHYGVINVQGEKASFVNSKRAFYDFKAAEKNKEARVNELIQYFGSPKGDQDYKEMKIERDAARARNAELKN